MSTLQEQIDTLDQSVLDMESSASGVLAYVTQYTFDEYSRTFDRVLNDIGEKLTSIDTDIVDASGSLRILKMGIMIKAAS